MSKSHTELLIDQNGIEIIVSYTIEYVKQIEDFHGIHDLSSNYITIDNVEVIIAGSSIDILPKMNEDQILAIINHLSIY